MSAARRGRSWPSCTTALPHAECFPPPAWDARPETVTRRGATFPRDDHEMPVAQATFRFKDPAPASVSIAARDRPRRSPANTFRTSSETVSKDVREHVWRACVRSAFSTSHIITVPPLMSCVRDRRCGRPRRTNGNYCASFPGKHGVEVRNQRDVLVAAPAPVRPDAGRSADSPNHAFSGETQRSKTRRREARQLIHAR